MENMKELQALETLEVKTSKEVPEGRDGMEYLVGLGKQNRDFKAVRIDGRVYVNASEELQELEPYETPAPQRFDAYTLSGLIKWLHEDVDKLFERFKRLYIRVENETTVLVLSPAFNRYKKRETLARCSADLPRVDFNRYMSQEDFIIHLQTRFAADEELETVASLVGNIRMENEAQTADDGMSQRVTIKDGVSAVKDTVVKNPFALRPFRTYEEIEQPISPFVLRIRKGPAGPEAALYEADGGVWKNEAVKKIGAWLEEKCADIPVVVIA